MINNRLDKSHINDVYELLKDYNSLITKDMLIKMCIGSNPIKPTIQMYGYYHNGSELAAIMVATYLYVMPHEDNPKGKIVHISGAYTKENMRHKGYAGILLEAIEKDAKEYFDADYLCADCIPAGEKLAISQGFVHSNDSRVWKLC